jgi:uncharacterized protein YegP (UPF0339 family)
MPAKYVLAHKPGKGYHWNLVATNGQVIASSEHYETKRAAMKGIASTQKNAATTVIVDADEQAAGKAARKATARKAAAKKTAAKRASSSDAASDSESAQA